jgi:predicted nuclease of predicted toxin-antitoxin system
VRVKLDENMPRSASQVLVAAGHDVDTVVDEGLAGASDPEIVAAAASLAELIAGQDLHALVVAIRPSR